MKDFKVPKHWMSEFFYACIELELHMNEEALTRYQDISAAGFTNSSYVNSQIAICLYNLRGMYYARLFLLDLTKMLNPCVTNVSVSSIYRPLSCTLLSAVSRGRPVSSLKIISSFWWPFSWYFQSRILLIGFPYVADVWGSR